MARQPCNCGPCEERDEHRVSVPTYSRSPSSLFVPVPLWLASCKEVLHMLFEKAVCSLYDKYGPWFLSRMVTILPLAACMFECMKED